MIGSALVDFISKLSPRSADTGQAKRSVTDQTFNEIFNTIRQDRESHKDLLTHDQSTEDYQPQASATDSKPYSDQGAGNSDNRIDDTARRADRRNNPPEDKALGKAQLDTHDSAYLAGVESSASMIAGKLDELAAKDPGAFDKLMKNLPNMTLKELGQALGLSDKNMAGLAKTFGLEDKLDARLLDAISTRLASLKKAHDPAGANIADKKPGGAGIAGNGSDTGQERRVSQKETADTGHNSDWAKHHERQNTDSPLAGKAEGRTAAQREMLEAKARLSGNAKASDTGIQIMKNGQVHAGRTGKMARPMAGQGARDVFERMVVDQVVKKARFSVRANGSSSMTIQLDPPNLGRVNMRINVHDNLVRAVLVAESHPARVILENNIDTLKASLNQQGLKVDQISVFTAGTGGYDTNHPLGRQRDTGNRKNGQGHDQGALGTMDAVEQAADPSSVKAHDGALDIMA